MAYIFIDGPKGDFGVMCVDGEVTFDMVSVAVRNILYIVYDEMGNQLPAK